MNSNIDYILKLSHEKNVKFVRLWFTDILGILKSFAIDIDELEDALTDGVRFDGATLNGFVRSDEFELIAMPDPSTFQILPWRPKEDSVARMFCDIYTPDMVPYEEDSRFILKKTLKKASDRGFVIYTGPEIEFFFFKNQENPEPIDKGGYFDLTPLDSASDLRRQVLLTIHEMGIGFITSHHEGACSQHEIDLRHDNALTTADNIMTMRIAIKEIAEKNNVFASFMPKPLTNQNGSGMHMHLSLFSNEENAFFDEKGTYHLSDTAKHFIAGLLRHAPEFFAVTNQWINSYKRFQKGYESPTHISWSSTINSSLVRVPQIKKGKPESMRVELRNPDPSCNPYLALAAIIACGIKGIEEKYKLPDPTTETLSKYSMEEITDKGLQPVPGNLAKALHIFKNSELMREIFGSSIINKFVENKRIEIDEFNRYVTDFEINKYYSIL